MLETIRDLPRQLATALLAAWELAARATDGSLLHMSGRGTMVSRRRPDGTWGIVLDDPQSPP